MPNTSDLIRKTTFVYPPNLHELDLASMVTMYRSRGEPRKAAPGKMLACALTKELIREGKWWFGLYYSQSSWDSLLTKNAKGVPMTPTEFLAMGKIATSQEPVYREFLEVQLDVSPKLSYLLLNDLKQFGFVLEDPQSVLTLSLDGEKALDGLSRRLFEKRFQPDLLFDTLDSDSSTSSTSRASTVNQVSLFT